MTAETAEEARFAKVFSECMDMTQAQAFNTALLAFLEHGRLRRFCLTIKKECDIEGKGDMLRALEPLLPEKYREPFMQFNEPYLAPRLMVGRTISPDVRCLYRHGSKMTRACWLVKMYS